MEGDRARRLTTLAVTGALVVALACFAAAIARGLTPGPVTPLRGLVPGLLRAEAGALAGAGTLVLLVVPLVRLSGLAAQFWRAGDRTSLAAAAATLALLVLSFLLR